ncbi:MAG: DUF4389 domain-containing protein [Bacteroidetes bacterium]|nr:MAG: DUF4389 domain-containing protein [Bacteroidota bacterium]
MKISVTYQENYSRGDLLLRSFFGAFYIVLPHVFMLFFALFWSSIISFISFWVILFTGNYPRSFWEFNLGLQKWNLRLNAVLSNLVDGYPDFWVNKNNDDMLSNIELEYPETSNRGTVLLRLLFGVIYVYIPHMFVLLFRSIAGNVLMFLAWWVVLFTGKYPQSWHEFNVGTLRWSTRVALYMSYLTDEYPPFSGQ